MEIGTLIIAVVLLLAIISFEGWRRWSRQPIGLLSVANAVFALNFCVSPIMLAMVSGTEYGLGPFGKPLFMLSIFEMLNLDGDVYRDASFASVLAYTAMVASYVGLTKWKCPVAFDATPIPTQWLVGVGLFVGMVSIVALLLYSGQFQEMSYGIGSEYTTLYLIDDGHGLIKMMKLGMLVRVEFMDIKWGFLQIVVMLGVPSVMLLSAAALRMQGISRGLLLIAALVVWCAVLARAFHASGRMELTVFLTIVPLAALLCVRSARVAVAGGGLLLLFGLFMTLARHEFFPNPGETISVMILALTQDSLRAVLYLFNEFAFPFPVAAHTLLVAPESVGYRYFIDIPLAMLYMLPSIGGADTWPEMISHIHERMVPLMLPYDLISFGYYSFGWGGIVVVFVAMGAALAVMDAWLAPGTGWLGQILRAAWMMYLPFRIMYADPYTSMKTGFGLIVGTVLVVVMIWMAKRWRQI